MKICYPYETDTHSTATVAALAFAPHINTAARKQVQPTHRLFHGRLWF